MPASQGAENTLSVTASQLRAARAFLGWSQAETAKNCNVGINTIGRMETGEQFPGPRVLAGMIETFKEAGIVFSSEQALLSVSLRIDPDQAHEDENGET